LINPALGDVRAMTIQTKEDEIGRACSTSSDSEKPIQILVGKFKVKRQCGDTHVEVMVILNYLKHIGCDSV
jgi:hypothetical protein